MTTKDLYEFLVKMPNLHSMPIFDGHVLIWNLYENAKVRAYIDEYDTYCGVESESIDFPSVHWHPEEKDMLEELYTLGKKGNVVVLKKSLIGVGVFYMGEPEKYIYTPSKKWHWGKLTYLSQK